MPSDLYSDRYLKALIEEEPRLADAFFSALAQSDYCEKEEVIYCLETPTEILEKVGISACINPSFPIETFERLILNRDILTKHFWKVFRYPHIKQHHIEELMKDEDSAVRGLALSHPFGDPEQLLSYLQSEIAKPHRHTGVIREIVSKVKLSDVLFSYLVSVNHIDLFDKTIGQALWANPSLSQEQKAELVLSGVIAKDDSRENFWGRSFPYLSSIPYFQLFRVSFYYSEDITRFKSIPRFDPKIEEFLTKMGHHLSLLIPKDMASRSELELDALKDLCSKEFMNRLLWTDLCSRDDFEINRRNAYRTDDVFISHPILGREFEEADADAATHLGGVFIFNNQAWLSGEAELPAAQAAHELYCYGGSLKTIVEETRDYETLGQRFIALTFEIPDLPSKYGFEFTESAEDWMIEAALAYAESDSFDVSARLNPLFGEMLSWSKLPDTKKGCIVEFLILGLSEKLSKLRNDCIHFLGCISLHEDTPSSILEKLSQLNDPMINEILANRT